MVSAQDEGPPHEVVFKLPHECNTSGQFTLCWGVVALGLSELFGSICNDALLSILDLAEDGPHGFVAGRPVRVKDERLIRVELRISQDWGLAKGRPSQNRCLSSREVVMHPVG